MNNFRYTSYAQEIIFGPGSLAQLDQVLQRYPWRRMMLCSTQALRRNGNIVALEKVLGERLVVSYEGVQPHVLDFQVAEASVLANENEIDAIIGFGGGSSIGLAKALSLSVEGRRTRLPARAAFPTDQPLVPVIAIPTTYAGSEMTPTCGITHHVDGAARKVTVTDAKVTPKLTVYDPLLTLNLSPVLTASTGINALAHCIEALYSITRNPLSTAAAISGARAIIHALPRCYADGSDVEARTEMLTGAFLAGSALSQVAMALHHGLCHVLGGTAGVPHGIANGIILPHAMRYNLEATAPHLLPVVEAMGIDATGSSPVAAVEAAIQRIAAMIEHMQLPLRLRDAGVPEQDLPHLAQVGMQSRAIHNNPRPITSTAQLETILREAW